MQVNPLLWSYSGLVTSQREVRMPCSLPWSWQNSEHRTLQKYHRITAWDNGKDMKMISSHQLQWTSSEIREFQSVVDGIDSILQNAVVLELFKCQLICLQVRSLDDYLNTVGFNTTVLIICKYIALQTVYLQALSCTCLIETVFQGFDNCLSSSVSSYIILDWSGMKQYVLILLKCLSASS